MLLAIFEEVHIADCIILSGKQMETEKLMKLEHEGPNALAQISQRHSKI